MTTGQEQADSRAAREIERAETCQTALQLAGMALNSHPLGYMITKGVEIAG